jgi:hypothetical protein
MQRAFPSTTTNPRESEGKKMPDIEVNDLIDHELIARANRKAVELASRAHLSRNDLTAATSVRAAAEDAATNSPSLENEAAWEKADRAFRVAQKVSAAAEQEHRNYANWLPLAKGAAHGPLYMAGVRARIAAAKKADNAKILAEEAERDFKAAVQTIYQAHAAGHQHLRAINNASHLLVSEAEELNIWRAHNSDPFAETNEWVQSVLAQEPK